MKDENFPKELEGHGYVYLMLDGINPNTFKFGLSKDPIERVEQLYTTGTPERLIPWYVWLVKDMRSAERIGHWRFAEHRLNDKREFFEVVTFEAALNHGLEVPHQHFGGIDLADNYLYSLIELLEDDWRYAELEFQQIDISHLREKKAFYQATQKKINSL